MALPPARRPRGSYKLRISIALSTSQLQNSHATMAASMANAHGHFLNAIFVMPDLNPSFAILLDKHFEQWWALPIAKNFGPSGHIGVWLVLCVPCGKARGKPHPYRAEIALNDGCRSKCSGSGLKYQQ